MKLLSLQRWEAWNQTPRRLPKGTHLQPNFWWMLPPSGRHPLSCLCILSEEAAKPQKGTTGLVFPRPQALTAPQLLTLAQPYRFCCLKTFHPRDKGGQQQELGTGVSRKPHTERQPAQCPTRTSTSSWGGSPARGLGWPCPSVLSSSSFAAPSRGPPRKVPRHSRTLELCTSPGLPLKVYFCPGC